MVNAIAAYVVLVKSEVERMHRWMICDLCPFNSISVTSGR